MGISKLACSVALLLCSFAGVSAAGAAMAQQPAGNIRPDSAMKGVDVDRIVRAFTAKETEFRQALSNYAFKRDAIVQTIGMGGVITGEYHRVSQFSLDDRGELYEKITFFPQPTLTEISFTQEDLEDLGGVQPFALVAAKLNQYNFSYVGKERTDEIDTYVFDVAPKVVPKRVSERFFQGRVWVDDRDLQIVKVRGKGVPEGDQRFPIFETYRQQIDGRYWFPTYTYADDELVFKDGQVVHLRMTVRYTDFKRFRSEVKIIEVDGAGDEDAPQQKQQTPPKSKP
jgi:muconolactone delta-isomerase